MHGKKRSGVIRWRTMGNKTYREIWVVGGSDIDFDLE